MPDNIYVAGFPYKTTKEELAALFASCGTVVSAKVILDRETGRPTGFGFVEMSTLEEAKAAVAKLNGADIGGRKLFVVEARPQKEREERPDRRPAAPSAPGRAPRPGEPGFVERRSGKDRRGAGVPGVRRAETPAPSAAPEKSWKPFGKKSFEKKPFDPSKKPWVKKPFDPAAKKTWEKKPHDPAAKKPWEKKPFDPSKKWEKKSFDPAKKKPFGAKPFKKPWDKNAPGDKPASKTVPPLRGEKWFPKKD